MVGARGCRARPPAAWCRSPLPSSAIWFRWRERQVAMGRLLFAIMTGNLLGATLAGVVGDLVGWRGVFFVTGAFGARGAGGGRAGFRGFAETAGRFDLSTLDPELPRHLHAIRWPRSVSARCFSKRCSCTACFPISRRCCTRRARRAPRSPASSSPASASAARSTAVCVSRLLPRLGETPHDALRRHGRWASACSSSPRALPWPVEFANFAAARLRLLHAARRHPDLRQRTGAGRARLGDGAAFVFLLSWGRRPGRSSMASACAPSASRRCCIVGAARAGRRSA